MTAIDPNVVDDVAKRLASCDRVLFITGAGLSADSGLPTYRGIGGLYDDRDTEEGVPIEEALSGGMLAQKPALTWRYIRQIEAAGRGAGPNRGHEVIAAFETRFETVVLTQNVDGLHQAAGSSNVIPIHGDVHDLSCTACSWTDRVDDYAHLTSTTPSCPECASLVRPDVVLFGEMLPLDASWALKRERRKDFDAVFSIGTTSVFYYIAAPVIDAARAGKLTVEVNPGESRVSELVTIRVRAGAAAFLDALWARLSA